MAANKISPRATKKISELDSVESLSGSELIPVVHNGTTRKATMDQVVEKVRDIHPVISELVKDAEEAATSSEVSASLAENSASIASTMAANAEASAQAALTAEPKDYSTFADLPSPSSVPEGTSAHVNNDPNPDNNGRWAMFGGAWVQSADRVTGLEGRVARADMFLDDVDSNVFDLVTPKNLYNPSENRTGFTINSNGQIAPFAGRIVSGFIAVDEGEEYTITAATTLANRVGWYSAPVDSAHIGASAVFPNGNTVEAPAGAKWAAILLTNGTTVVDVPDDLQFERGAASEYEPWFMPYRVVRGSAIPAVDVRLDAVEGLSQVSPNLYNPAEAVEGRYIINTPGDAGLISGAAGWAFSGFIPVVGGQTYTLNANAARREGLAFYTTNEPDGSGAIAGSYVGESVLPITVTAPADAEYVAFNVKSSSIPEPSQIQLEQGPVATAYRQFGRRFIADEAVPGLDARVTALEGGGEANPVTRLVLGGEGASISYVEGLHNGDIIRREFRPWPVASLTASAVFNPTADKINGVTLKTMGDDAAPYRLPGATIGANHGYGLTEITASSHGKSAADVGSVWTAGGVEYVILGIKDANTLLMAPRHSNGGVPVETFTHVSGAANTSSITATARTTGRQWYAATINRECRCFVDGIEVLDRDAAISFSDRVQFHESYEVLDRQTAIEWFIANPGTTEVQAEGQPAFSVTLVHQFDRQGNYTIYADFVARSDGLVLQDIMFTQAGRMNPSPEDGEIKYYVPKALPFTHEGASRDWAMIDTSDTASWTTRADITPERAEPDGLLVDRLVMLSNNYGFAIGYAPVQDAAPEVRRENATVKALQISSTNGKVYPSAIDSGVQTLEKGDAFKAVAYRNIFKRDAARTDSYVVRMHDRAFIYADWHNAAKVDRVPIPADLVGRPFTVIEARNATLLSESLTTGLLVDVSATGDYGYLIIEVI